MKSLLDRARRQAQIWCADEVWSYVDELKAYADPSSKYDADVIKAFENVAYEKQEAEQTESLV